MSNIVDILSEHTTPPLNPRERMENQFNHWQSAFYVIFFLCHNYNVIESIELSFYYFCPRNYCVMLTIRTYITEINS